MNLYYFEVILKKMFIIFLILVLSKTNKELVKLESQSYEIGLEGNNIKLNITSLDNIPFDLNVWRNGKIEKWRQSKIVLEGDFSWLTISSQRPNLIQIKWKEQKDLNTYLCVLIIIMRILSFFNIKGCKSIFMFLAIILAVQDLNFNKFINKLIHSWAFK